MFSTKRSGRSSRFATSKTSPTSSIALLRKLTAQLELRARERQRKLISKIDAALARLDDGTYGFCEETGEPIALRRLEARPIATLSVEAQERHERKEKLHRADD